MKTVKKIIINIDWEGPFSFANLSEINDSNKDYGIYQVYGCHPVYGSNVLLYIGKADQQTFKVRIQQSYWDYYQDGRNSKFYVGRLSGITTPQEKEWCCSIALAEALLIYSHKPAFNSQYIQSISHKQAKYVHIFNWMEYRDLMPEVSGERWMPNPALDNEQAYGTH